MKIRTMLDVDEPIRKKFLFESIFQKDPKNLIPVSEIEKPQFQIYLTNFGKQKGDHGLIAEINDRAVGAVWTRIVSGFGSLDKDTPEFVISVLPEYRGRQIGTRLMTAMLEELKKEGYLQASLACQKENGAVNLYRNVGFEIIDENEEEYIFKYTF